MSIAPATGLQVLLSREQIASRVAAMASQISNDFRGDSVLLLGVLKGATIFLSDLARQMTVDATFDFLAVSSYSKGTKSSGEVRLTKDLDESLQGRNVILVEDILDTGLTLNYLKNMVSARQPRCLRIAVLLDKPSRRIQPVHADYIGFTIEDVFVVGYGLDYAERYRNLSDICILSKELQ